MDLQIPLMIIDRRRVSVISILFTNRRVTHLRIHRRVLSGYETQEKILDSTGQHRDCFDKTAGIVSVYQNSARG